ncbi:MAG: RagB/SusD family nutrient uptake outer membrane protein [Muribaculaceae bacterium]|nr:RagB/SusD family nutrient uptake outer membrane protein [Muribaculaceae bacterium]
MKSKINILAILVVLCTLCFASCTEEPNTGIKVECGKYKLSGKVEKGPFVRGSSISVQPLNETMSAIGTVFNGEIKDDAGSFNLGQIELASQFVRIATDGYYFNEVNGNLSTGQLHLIALADISDKSTVNINILTHLKSARIQKLVESGKSFAEANRQAQKELLTQFGLQAYENQSAETLSIASGNDGAGVLIVVSSIILNNRSDAEITQYLSALSQDLADDGTFTEANRQKIVEDGEFLRNEVERISSNIISRYEELGQTVSIPDLRYFFDWDGDGIAGNELNSDPRITLSQTEVNFGKDGGEANIAIDANFKYSLVPLGSSDVIIDSDYSESFLCAPEPLSVEKSINGNILTIKGGVNKANMKRSYTINIYNVFDDVMATITVNFEANPNYGLALSENGEKVMAVIMAKLTEAHRAYSTFLHEYCTASSHHLEPYDSRLNKMFNDYYSVVSQVNNVSRYLYEAGFDDYPKLIQTYNAIAYAEMMEVWGDMPLVKYYDDPMEYHQRNGMNEIRNYFISILKEALPFASNDKAPGSNESDSNIIFDTGCGNGSRSTAGSNLANKLFFISKDILYLALGDLYIQGEQYSEAYSNYDKAIKNYAMSNSINFDRNNSELIFSPDQINLGGNSRSRVQSRIVNLTVTTWPLYFLSDIRLRMAECQLKLSNTSIAQSIINDIKGHHPEFNYVSGSTLEQIDLLHRDWYHPAYLAYLKRSGLGTLKYGFENYQLICPIPEQQISLNPRLTQNPGY